jgi:hypothetical protein
MICDCCTTDNHVLTVWLLTVGLMTVVPLTITCWLFGFWLYDLWLQTFNTWLSVVRQSKAKPSTVEPSSVQVNLSDQTIFFLLCYLTEKSVKMWPTLLYCLRHNMTGWLWHRIMCQSGHDWMAMPYDHVSEWTWRHVHSDTWSYVIASSHVHSDTWSYVIAIQSCCVWDSRDVIHSDTWSYVDDISTVSDTTWLDSYDIGSCVRMDMTGCYDIWSCVRVDMTGWLWHMIMCQRSTLTHDHMP